jgi:hypothetical protein
MLSKKNGCENKKKIKFLCREPKNSPRQRNFFAESRRRPLGKEIFAESLTEDPRQRLTAVSLVGPLPRALFAESRALGKGRLCRELTFAEGLTLGKEQICRRPFFAESPALGKEIFAKSASLPRARLSAKSSLPSARVFALGKDNHSR